MSDKRRNNQYEGRKRLRTNGWDVRQDSRYNSGSETVRHSICKQLAGHYLKHELDYRVDMEVPHETRGTVDVLAWGKPDRISPLAVECETSPTQAVEQQKYEAYYVGTPIQELYVLNVSEMPDTTMDAYEWVSKRL